MTNTSNPVYTQLSVIFVFILQSLKVKVVLSPFSSLFGAISWYCDFVLVLYFIGSGFWSMVSCCQTFSSFWLFPKILYCLGSKFWCFSFVSVLFLDLIVFPMLYCLGSAGFWCFDHASIISVTVTNTSWQQEPQIQYKYRQILFDSSRNHNAHFSVFNFLHHHHCHHFHKIMVITRSLVPFLVQQDEVKRSQHLLWQQAKPSPSWAFN